MKNRAFRREHPFRAGVSLIEITVAMAIVTIVMVMGLSMMYTSNRFVDHQQRRYNATMLGENITNLIARNLNGCKIPFNDETKSFEEYVQPYFITFKIPIDKDHGHTNKCWRCTDLPADQRPNWKACSRHYKGYGDGDFFDATGNYMITGRPRNIGLYGGVGGTDGYVVVTFVPSGEIVDESLPMGQQTQSSIAGITDNTDQFIIIGTGHKNINAAYENEYEYQYEKYVLGCFLIELYNDDGTLAQLDENDNHMRPMRAVGGIITDSEYYANLSTRKQMRAVPGTCKVAVPAYILYHYYEQPQYAEDNNIDDSIDGRSDPDPCFAVTANVSNKLPMKITFKLAILKFNPTTSGWFFRPMRRVMELRNPQEPWCK